MTKKDMGNSLWILNIYNIIEKAKMFRGTRAIFRFTYYNFEKLKTPLVRENMVKKESEGNFGFNRAYRKKFEKENEGQMHFRNWYKYLPKKSQEKKKEKKRKRTHGWMKGERK